MLRRDVRGVRDPMRTARGLRAACLLLGLALLGSACTGPERDAARDGVRGGTLRVLSAEAISGLDTAVTYTPNEVAIARAYARTLYGYDLSGPPEQATVLVPDIATGPPQVSADRRTYTFTLRPGVRYAPRSTARSPPRTSSPPSKRFYDEPTPASLAPLPGRQYADLIAGAAAFGAGEADRIAGLAAPDPRTLKITLVQPASDLPVDPHPGDVRPGAGGVRRQLHGRRQLLGPCGRLRPLQAGHLHPGETVVLDRNPNWDPATDPLRKAWVDRIQVKLDVGAAGVIQRAIEQEQADLALNSHVPQTRIAALRADPERSGRLEVARTGCQWFLFLGTDRRAGAIADVRVRRAVNYAIDKAAYRDAIAGGTPPPASWPPPSSARARSATSPTTCTRPRVAGATRPRPRRCWPRPATPRGLTLGFATFGSGRQAAATKPIQDSLAKAGIDLKVKRYDRISLWFESLAVPAKRLEHQLGLTAWCPDYLGDNARQTIVTRFDGRHPHPHRRQHQRVRQPGGEPHDRPGPGRARPGPPGGDLGRDRPADHARRPRRPAHLGEPGVPAVLAGPAGPTIPGRPRPASPPRGWTRRAQADRDAREGAEPDAARRPRAACLGLGLALVAASCTGPGRDPGQDGARGGYPPGAERRPRRRARHGPRLRGPAAARLRQDPVRLRPLGRPGDDTCPGHRHRPPAGLGRPAHLHLPAPGRGPLRPTGQPRGHRPGLHHRHRAALRPGISLGRAAVRQPHRRRQRIRGREGDQYLRAGRPRPPDPQDHLWTSRPATSCGSSPCRSSPRCRRSTRPATGSGRATRAMWSAPAPTG